jgi:threonine dehydratase
VIVMPEGAMPVKVEATRALGAEVIMAPGARREIVAEAVGAERGMTLSSIATCVTRSCTNWCRTYTS